MKTSTEFICCTMNACRLIRLEVPLHIVKQDTLEKPVIETLTQLPQILSEEEQEAYKETTDVGDLDLITQIHNAAG